LNERVVAALVEGAALPENIVVDVREEGLSFQPSEQYLSELAKIGATPGVLEAVKKAKVTGNQDSSNADDNTVLDHLFGAGQKLKAKKLMEAARDLVSASSSIEDHPELAFVMGEIMRQEGGHDQAAALFSKLVDINPEFPEAHTKLSYELYRDDDSERGVVEARAALARTPNNAEAHKNMALNLEKQKQFDAAIAEYQKALAIKPDYTVIH
jgi:tetratricopeptide (TPR) repeat protein